MNVLFLTIAYPLNQEQRNIYSDLMQEFQRHGHVVYVVTPLEKRLQIKTQLIKENGIHLLKVQTGNITQTNLIEKGISTLLIERQFIQAIKNYYQDIRFDLILYSTPPVTFAKVIKYIKYRDKATSYLLLKDIFPQNAVDIGMMREGSLMWRWFRHKEKNLYKYSDYIGCMSQANVNFLIEHNPQINTNAVEVCPNSIDPLDIVRDLDEQERVRAEYGIPRDATIFIYGGNLGKPQGISFLLDVLKTNRGKNDRFFFIIGAGTEYENIQMLLGSGYKNVRLMKYLPKPDYDKLVAASDVGLIFLDKRFTIPNFPSRLLTYMEFSMPILAATDKVTDIREVIEENEMGFWCESGDLGRFNQCLDSLCEDKDSRVKMGENARACLLANYTVSKSYDIITKHFAQE